MSDPLLRNLRDPGSGTDATLLRVCWQAADEIERLRARIAELEKALHGILGYFRSGNSIPVERATIKADAPEIIFAKSVL